MRDIPAITPLVKSEPAQHAGQFPRRPHHSLTPPCVAPFIMFFERIR